MDSKQTCSGCKHWQRHAWENGKGWHDQGTCGKVFVSGRQIVNHDRPGLFPMIQTGADFGCNRWEGKGAG